MVIFAHGSGSSRHSPRNRFVADQLARAGLGTLLIDLLSAEEEQDRANVFNVDLLAQRLVAATVWLRQETIAPNVGVRYFGASTGAAAALWAAADPTAEITAVVSRGGSRPRPVASRAGARTDPAHRRRARLGRARAESESPESDIPVLRYQDELFHERRLRSVTANTRRDGEEFLTLAARFAISATTVAYPMAEAPTALADLAHGRFGGAAVLHN